MGDSRQVRLRRQKNTRKSAFRVSRIGSLETNGWRTSTAFSQAQAAQPEDMEQPRSASHCWHWQQEVHHVSDQFSVPEATTSITQMVDELDVVFPIVSWKLRYNAWKQNKA